MKGMGEMRNLYFTFQRCVNSDSQKTLVPYQGAFFSWFPLMGG